MRFKITVSITLSLITIAAWAQQVSLVKDIYPGTSQSYPWNLTVFKNRLFFYAYDPVNGQQFWVMDSGTAPKILFKMTPAVQPGNLQMWGGDISISEGNMIAECSGKLYFCGSDGIDGAELWEYDGISAPKMTKNINTTTTPLQDAGSKPHWLTVINNKLYFNAWQPQEGNELWEYDPAINILNMVLSVAGPTGVNPTDLIIYNNRLILNANNELQSFNPGTGLVTNIDPPPTGQSSNPKKGYTYRDKFYFVADDGIYGRELYSYDFINGAKRLTDINPGSGNAIYPFLQTMMVYNDKLYFGGYDGSHTYLYTYDTITKKPVVVDKSCEAVDCFAVCKNQLFFRGADVNNGLELWSYDGLSSPKLRADIYTGKSDGAPLWLTEVWGDIYFHGITDSTGREIFKFSDLPGAGVNAIPSSRQAKVYPNPTTGNINIELDKQYNVVTVEVYSILGQSIFTRQFINTNSVSTLIDAPAGLYIIRVKAGTDECTTFKILKEN